MTCHGAESRLINRLFNAVNRRSPILIQTAWPSHIGDCAEEIRYGLLKAQREGKRTLLVVHRHQLWGRLQVRIANRELFLLESEHLYPGDSMLAWLTGWILTAALVLIRPWILLWRSERFRRIICRGAARGETADAGEPEVSGPSMPTIGMSRLWRPDGARTFSWDVVRQLRWSEQYARYRPPRLADPKRRIAERIRAEMGIPAGAWFVALHVRENLSRTDNMVRNASIGNFLDAIRAITDAGGWVVRLGDAAMTPLPAMERVVDYALSGWKSELMDVYLLAECRFFFGTISGPLEAAWLLDRPVLTVNATQFSFWGPMRRTDLGILKHVYSPRLGRVLTVKELLEEPFDSQDLTDRSARCGYRYIENNPEEIRDAVEEFLRPERGPLTDLQLMFQAARTRAVRRWLDNGEVTEFAYREDELTEYYRMASRAESAEGSLCQKYLEQNWDQVPSWLVKHTELASARGDRLLGSVP